MTVQLFVMIDIVFLLLEINMMMMMMMMTITEELERRDGRISGLKRFVISANLCLLFDRDVGIMYLLSFQIVFTVYCTVHQINSSSSAVFKSSVCFRPVD